jgi:hypothetical protein
MNLSDKKRLAELKAMPQRTDEEQTELERLDAANGGRNPEAEARPDQPSDAEGN